MKLFEISSLRTTEPEHAFWQRTSGPNNTPGVSLHYIQDLAQHHDALRAQADEKGDTRWRENIDRMADRTVQSGQRFSHPDLGWWSSMERFDQGEQGVGSGLTKDDILGMGVTIHDSKEEAVRAAGY